jgi:hypothetical protein
MRAAACLLTLAGCGGGDRPSGSTPVVRASSGGSAAVTIIACPPSEARAMAVGELIQVLTQHDELVIARDGGHARLTINACPPNQPPEIIRPAPRRAS